MGMRLWKKIVLTLLVVVILLVAGLVAVFLFWLGPTAKALAEGIGPKALGTRVKIESLSINPRKGTLDLHGFQIGAHEGFSRTNTWELTGLHIAIDVRSLFSDTIVIHAIEIDSPHFTYEQNEATDNISEFVKNIRTFAKTDPNQPKKKKPEQEEDSEKTPKKVVVEALVINDMQMHLANTYRPELDIQLGVEQLSLSLTNGLARLDHLALSDPGLLSTPNVTEIESVDVRFDSDSLYSSGPLVIEEVRISSPYAWYEQNSQTDTLGAFMQIADMFATGATNAPPKKAAEAPPPQPGEKDAPPVVLRNLAIDDIRLHLVNTADPKLNMAVKLRSVAVNALRGTLKLGGLTVGNPARLATPNLFELDSVDVKLDPASLLSGTVVIEDVQVSKPHAFLERNPETDTVTELMKIADRFAAKTGAATNAPATEAKVREPETKGQKAPPPIELRNLEIGDIQLKLLDSTQTNTPAALRTLASIGQISGQLSDGSLQIGKIAIPNPPGFAASNLFQLANIQIAIDPGSIFSEQVAIQKVFIDSPNIQIEQTENSGNLTSLQETIQGFVPSPKSPSSPQNKPIPDAGKPQKSIPLDEQPVILHTLLVSNFAMHVIAPIPTNMPRDGVIGRMDIRGKVRLGERLNLDQINPLHSDEVAETNTSIDLLSFDLLTIQPLKGLLEVSNLEIGNPEGFANKNLIQAERYRMDFNPSTIQSNVFIIEDILVDKPKVAYERKLATDNIAALQELIDSILRRREVYSETPAPEKEPELIGPPAPGETQVPPLEPAGKKVVIEHLELSEGIVRAKISKLPTIPVIPLHFEMNDLGKEEGGASVQDAFGKVFGAFYDAIIGVVGNTTGLAGDALKGAGSFATDTLGTLTGGLIGTDSKDETEEQK